MSQTTNKPNWAVSSDTILEMYRKISDGLIKYLTDKGMKQPHPSKEFILQMIDRAISISKHDNPIPNWNYTYPYTITCGDYQPDGIYQNHN